MYDFQVHFLREYKRPKNFNQTFCVLNKKQIFFSEIKLRYERKLFEINSEIAKISISYY